MTGRRGRDMVLKIGDGGVPEQFVTVAGLRVVRLDLSATPIETTMAESAERWREIAGAVGVKSADIVGDGLFKDAASDELVRSAFFMQSAPNWRVVEPGFGALLGPFVVRELSFSGDYEGLARFSIRLTSAGVVSFEPM